jgi:hypothetical protein
MRLPRQEFSIFSGFRQAVLLREPSERRIDYSAFHGNVHVSVKVRFPDRRNARKSEDCPGSSCTSMPARNPRVYGLGTRYERNSCPFAVVGTSSTAVGSF